MRLICILLVLFFGSITNKVSGATIISGELKKWHTITLLFDGVNTNEQAVSNPFYDYRLNVTFTKGLKTYVVPGHYAADGNAAETSDSTGNKWRVYFSPDEAGTWNYSVSFRTASAIAIDDNVNAGTAVVPLNGEVGSFVIAATDKTGRDFRGKGRLDYVGEHYLQFSETGEYFLKGGADSPENFLAYYEFDQTKDLGGKPTPGLTNGLHQYANHAQHWNSGPSWQSGKGKSIIGALNYLASHDINSVYFLTYNIDGGDGMDTWIWTDENERHRFDISKLDQWEIVFSHMDKLGIQLHVITQETENDNSLGGSGSLNDVRKLYYRELVSRFSHHLAIQWNLGEENNNTDFNRAAFAEYIRDTDPYNHPINVHTKWYNDYPAFYDGLLNNASYLQYFEATSIQGQANSYNDWAIDLRNDSEAAGRKWVVYGDEQGPAVDPAGNNNGIRKDALWGNLMGGGAGVEWYFGYQNTFGDIQSEDFAIVETLWEQTSYAINFFQDYLPFHEMSPDNSLLSAGNGDLCFAKTGEYYVIYLRFGGGGGIDLNIGDPGNYTVKWFNPRTGGSWQDGSVTSVTGNGVADLGSNPAGDNNDWVALIINDNLIVVPTTAEWTGAIDSDWFDAGNWLNGVLPDSTKDVTIPNVSPNDFPVIQGGAGLVAKVRDLQISTNTSLTILEANNAELSIYGDLTANGSLLGDGRLSFSGNCQLNSQINFTGILNVRTSATLNTNGNLVLESSASLMHGTGTVGGGGVVNGNVVIKRTGHSNPANYNFWSSPVSGQDVSILGNNLYHYIPGNATDTSQQGLSDGWLSASGAMTVGKGYISQGASTVSFNGPVNNANTSTPIKVAIERNVGIINNVPYNLIGNPFPSALDAAAFTLANNSIIDGAIYLWDDDGSGGGGWNTNQDYLTWNNLGSVSGTNSGKVFNGHIASGQSFFVVKLNDGTDLVEFRNSMRSTENDVFFRHIPIQRLWISVADASGHYNETLIGFLPDATAGKDQRYDARKFKGNSNLTLFSKLNSGNCAIQGLPTLSDDRKVVLGMDAGITGHYTISLKTIENLDETVVVWLEDKQLGVFQNLRLNQEYAFSQTMGTNIDRFSLHFNPPLEITASEVDCDGFGGEIMLEQAGNMAWNYILIDKFGDIISSMVSFNGIFSITGLSSGQYNLVLSDNNGYQIVKNIAVEEKEAVEAVFDVSSNGVPVNDPISFINISTGATQYEWDFGDGTILNNVENPTYSYLFEGSYEVILRALNNECEDEYSRYVQVQGLTTDIQNISDNDGLRIYGFNQSVFIEFGHEAYENAQVVVYNVFGEELYKERLPNKDTHQIQFQNIPIGYYLVKVITGTNISVEEVLLSK